MGLAGRFFFAAAGAGRFVGIFFLATLALGAFAFAVFFLPGFFLAGFFLAGFLLTGFLIFLGAFLAAFLPVDFFAFALEPFVFFFAISIPLSQSDFLFFDDNIQFR